MYLGHPRYSCLNAVNSTKWAPCHHALTRTRQAVWLWLLYLYMLMCRLVGHVHNHCIVRIRGPVNSSGPRYEIPSECCTKMRAETGVCDIKAV